MMKSIFAVLLAATFSISVFADDKDKKAESIHSKALTIDTHVDTPMALLNDKFDIGTRNEPPRSRVDFVRMKEGGLDAIFFAAFTGQRERTFENTEAAYKRANDMIDATYEVCDQYNEIAEVAFSVDDAARIETSGKRA